jgi:IclR family transcriptional regulator, KDG regulon repressor
MLGLNKSTVSRTMSTLASEGFVYKDAETKKYRLGLSILSLSGIVNGTMDVYHESQPILNRLVDTTNESVNISMLDNSDVIYLNKIECNHPDKTVTHIGKRNPPYCTSSGKLLLAYSNKDVVDSVVQKGLQKITKNTVTDPKRLLSDLEEIKANGYAYCNEELREGVSGIAAPVYDYKGKVIAAVAVVGPKQRIQQHKVQGIAKNTIHAALEISERMGYWK